MWEYIRYIRGFGGIRLVKYWGCWNVNNVKIEWILSGYYDCEIL